VIGAGNGREMGRNRGENDPFYFERENPGANKKCREGEVEHGNEKKVTRGVI